MRIIKGRNLPFIPAAHEDITNPGTFKRVLAHKEDLIKGQVQMINWARMPVGAAFSAHYHEDMEEVFIIVNGVATITVDGERSELGSGDAVIIAPKAVHTMTNSGKCELEYVVIGITTNQGGKTILAKDVGS